MVIKRITKNNKRKIIKKGRIPQGQWSPRDITNKGFKDDKDKKAKNANFISTQFRTQK